MTTFNTPASKAVEALPELQDPTEADLNDQWNAQPRPVHAAMEVLRAALATSPQEAGDAAAENLATVICREVAELPDRNSPDDWPDAMLVTHSELHDIVISAIDAARSPQQEPKALATPKVIGAWSAAGFYQPRAV